MRRNVAILRPERHMARVVLCLHQGLLNTSAVGEKETRFSHSKEVEAGDSGRIADGD